MARPSFGDILLLPDIPFVVQDLVSIFFRFALNSLRLEHHIIAPKKILLTVSGRHDFVMSISTLLNVPFKLFNYCSISEGDRSFISTFHSHSLLPGFICVVGLH